MSKALAMSDDPQLLPCPFCGGAAAVTIGLVRNTRTVDVICQDCRGTMPAFCEDDAIADWNSRVVVALRETLRKE